MGKKTITKAVDVETVVLNKLIGGNVSDIIGEWTKLFNKYGPTARVETSVDVMFDSPFINLEVEYDVEETDEEYKQRLDYEVHEKILESHKEKKKLQKDKDELERLKKEHPNWF